MDTLEIKKTAAVKAFKDGTPSDKALLKNLFPSQFGSIMQRVTSFETACQELGLDPDDELPFASPVNARQVATNGAHEMFVIAEALNEGWIPNWDNSNEYKYTVYFDMRNGRLVFNDVYAWGTGSRVGSRLCFKSRELAEYAGKQFIDVWAKFMVVNK